MDCSLSLGLFSNTCSLHYAERQIQTGSAQRIKVNCQQDVENQGELEREQREPQLHGAQAYAQRVE